MEDAKGDEYSDEERFEDSKVNTEDASAEDGELR